VRSKNVPTKDLHIGRRTLRKVGLEHEEEEGVPKREKTKKKTGKKVGQTPGKRGLKEPDKREFPRKPQRSGNENQNEMGKDLKQKQEGKRRMATLLGCVNAQRRGLRLGNNR